jgi:hypothetical protein
MKNFSDHLKHIQGKPHHVRKRIAFGTAMGGTVVIALVWIGVSLSTGVFAIHPATFAQSTGGNIQSSGTDTSNQNLAGAAAAPTTQNSGPAQIQIIDTSSATSTAQGQQTTIPF